VSLPRLTSFAILCNAALIKLFYISSDVYLLFFGNDLKFSVSNESNLIILRTSRPKYIYIYVSDTVCKTLFY